MKYLFFVGLVLACSIITSAQTLRVISGKITDEKGQPIANASITIRGAKEGASANSEGEYTISFPEKNLVTLIFSAVGYKTKEIKVGNSDTLNVILKSLDEILSDVVLMAAQPTTNRKSVSTTASSIRIRGMASISGNKKETYYKNYNLTDSTEFGRYNEDFNTEGYDKIIENPFLKVTDNPLSTFSIDVDAASYSNIRRFINSGQLPPAGAVRIEEMINYFQYNYAKPTGVDPFSVSTELSTCFWNPKHTLVLIGLQGKKINYDKLPASNLVFLIDVSGSMNDPNKLPLVQSSLKLLVDQLRPQDKVALVVYAGNSGLVMPSTSGKDKIKIKEAIDNLEAGGSTAGGAGIQLAYKTAKENFIKNGNNRVILCTDGDFNVGVSSDDGLESMIEKERKSGVFLTILGYGTGNYQDTKMQKLADKGNGNHAYIDGINEAKKVLINEFGGTLFTIAKDVKLQVEFNPTKVQGYRLIGYENRMLAKEDFNNDQKDAGDLGSGHTVTALYEIIPTGIKATELDSIDVLKYQKPTPVKDPTLFNDEIMNIKLRYKQPDGEVSKLLEHPVKEIQNKFSSSFSNIRFAAAVASFGMILRDSKYKGNADFNMIKQLASSAIVNDDGGYKKEFLELVKKASTLKNKKNASISEE